MSDIPRKRIKHYDGEGHARELTFSCFQRRLYFSKPYACDWFFNALEKARNKLPVHIWAYVVMPEHIHLLVWPTERDFQIAKLLETVKTSVGNRAGNHRRNNDFPAIDGIGRDFQFWQSGPRYDRNLDNDGTIWAAIDYIHLNPVRRSLCARAVDWPWSSASLFAGNAGPFPIDRESLPPDPRI